MKKVCSLGVALEEAPVQAGRRLGLFRFGCWDSLEGLSGLEFRALGFKVYGLSENSSKGRSGLDVNSSRASRI